ncbi:hypothetical protein DPMN_033407 [Dreissena polymorpha]|uniref:Uncharacterized protein n=1 Tax=Dreissena polymorpha TaxID=45954 RepID=A0A9D4RL42_DREPO|nr:hypothetical protein DPMN_148081 [Dreissena polymorpha]KAH3870225.1 hypothetical protein DPMN_033407 [Dreissena polymorpha]
MALGKKKTCELVGQWAQSIANHLYYCAASSAGNGDMVVARWMSIGNHVSDIHEGHGDLFPKCLHSPIQRNWIKKGMMKYVVINICSLFRCQSKNVTE